MKSLSEMAKIFALIDNTPAEKISQLDKLLRNLSQRHYMPPDKQEGRAFLYGDASVAVFRILYLAASFGLDRLHLEQLNTWLRKEPVPGESVIDEAFRRCRRKEDFRFHLVMDSEGKSFCVADWEQEESRASKAADAATAARGEIGRFSLPASTAIAKILRVMD